MKLEIETQEIAPGIFWDGLEVKGKKFCWKFSDSGNLISCDENGNDFKLEFYAEHSTTESEKP